MYCCVYSAVSQAAWTVRYQHTDVLGSVIAESNKQGTITQRFGYKPFGEGSPTQKTGVGYTGHLEDTDLGLTYMQQRYYDPVIGRFYSNDPVGFSADSPMMFNRYAYANNNPYKYTDPDGRIAFLAAVPYIAEGAVIARNAYSAYRIANTVSKIALNADNAQEAKDKVFEGTDEAKGKSGVKGEREGSGGAEGRDEAWDKIDGEESSPRDGVKVKDLEGGGRAETHSSTKSQDYPQGTPTIKIQDENGKVVGTVRYPTESKVKEK